MNKYAQYSKVDEAAANIGRMRGALQTCSKKKTFRTYEAAKEFGNDYDQNPYQCPWCSKYHLTRGRGTPPPLTGHERNLLHNCELRLKSPNIEAILKGLNDFIKLEERLPSEKLNELNNIIKGIENRRNSLCGNAMRFQRLDEKLNKIKSSRIDDIE